MKVAKGQAKLLKLKPKNKAQAQKDRRRVEARREGDREGEGEAHRPGREHGDREAAGEAEAVTSRSNSDRLALRQARIDVDDADDLIHEAESVGCGRG